MKEARFWTVRDDGALQCRLCPHACVIREGQTGLCGVRRNTGGKLMSLVWGRAVAAGVDPIEKKPLFHVRPGTLAFSIATVGCNLRCAFCQNSDISQYPIETGRIAGDDLPPEEVVAQAIASRCASISYTYTEPTIFLEYALDTARLAREEGLLNTLVTNGFTSASVIREEFPGLIDAANIDLKAFREDFYHRLCHARLKEVLDAIRAYHACGVWIEITTLIIPGENDGDEELREIAAFIHSLSPDIPWHLSRYYPRYRYDKAGPTPLTTIEHARDIGLSQGLNFVYTGNVTGHEGENTFCPGCGKAIISRTGYRITKKSMQKNRCAHCGHTIAGRFE